MVLRFFFFFFSSRRRHTRLQGDWSSDVCSSDLCCAFQKVSFQPGGGLAAGALGVISLSGVAIFQQARGPECFLGSILRKEPSVLRQSAGSRGWWQFGWEYLRWASRACSCWGTFAMTCRGLRLRLGVFLTSSA